MQKEVARIVTVFHGNLRKDVFGRYVVDTCPSDEDHLRNSETDPVTNKPICRHLVEEAFTRLLEVGKFGGRNGMVWVDLKFTEDQEAQSCSAQPVTTPTPTPLTPTGA